MLTGTNIHSNPGSALLPLVCVMQVLPVLGEDSCILVVLRTVLMHQADAGHFCRSYMCNLTRGAQCCLQGFMAASCEELTVTASLFLSISSFQNEAGVEEVPKHMQQ